jgi:excisionase family DNA binding protein
MFEAYDDLVSIEDFMDMLGIGRSKAYQLLKKNEVRSIKVGKTYRIPKLCVQEYVIQKVRLQIADRKF